MAIQSNDALPVAMAPPRELKTAVNPDPVMSWILVNTNAWPPMSAETYQKYTKQVKRMREEGMALKVIARELGINFRTVKKCLKE
jgi:DNA-binding NarL/FixJ family response regulator